jgi:hypothetical protein
VSSRPPLLFQWLIRPLTMPSQPKLPLLQHLLLLLLFSLTLLLLVRLLLVLLLALLLRARRLLLWPLQNL